MGPVPAGPAQERMGPLSPPPAISALNGEASASPSMPIPGPAINPPPLAGNPHHTLQSLEGRARQENPVSTQPSRSLAEIEREQNAKRDSLQRWGDDRFWNQVQTTFRSEFNAELTEEDRRTATQAIREATFLNRQQTYDVLPVSVRGFTYGTEISVCDAKRASNPSEVLLHEGIHAMLNTKEWTEGRREWHSSDRQHDVTNQLGLGGLIER